MNCFWNSNLKKLSNDYFFILLFYIYFCFLEEDKTDDIIFFCGDNVAREKVGCGMLQIFCMLVSQSDVLP